MKFTGENHIALLFQWSYSKSHRVAISPKLPEIIPRCYFNEVTRKSHRVAFSPKLLWYLVNLGIYETLAKTKSSILKLLKDCWLFFHFPPLFKENKFIIKDYILLYHSIFLRISLFLGFVVPALLEFSAWTKYCSHNLTIIMFVLSVYWWLKSGSCWFLHQKCVTT